MNMITPEFDKVSYGTKILQIFGTKLWNSLSYQIKSSENLETIVIRWLGVRLQLNNRSSRSTTAAKGIDSLTARLIPTLSNDYWLLTYLLIGTFWEGIFRILLCFRNVLTSVHVWLFIWALIQMNTV